MHKLEIRSTALGFRSKLVWSIFWTIVLAGVIIAQCAYIWVSLSEDIRIIAAYPFLFVFCMLELFAISGIFEVRWNAREVNTFVADSPTRNWYHFICTTYGLRGRMSVEEFPINRVKSIYVTQSPFARRHNIGNIDVTLVTFMGGETTEHSVVFRGVVDPFGIKDQILAQAAPHEGLEVDLHSHVD